METLKFKLVTSRELKQKFIKKATENEMGMSICGFAYTQAFTSTVSPRFLVNWFERSSFIFLAIVQGQQAFASKYDGSSLTFTVDCVSLSRGYHGLGLPSQIDAEKYFTGVIVI